MSGRAVRPSLRSRASPALLGIALVASPDPGTVLLEVPFLPQGKLLCGGASAAMVLRYWGEEDVFGEDFEHLVDGRRGGITTGDLARAVRARGWRAFPAAGDRDSVRRHLSQGRPLVALVRSSPDSLHYVVLAGFSSGALLYHDSSAGPLRSQSFEDFEDSWKTAGFWMLIILPPESPPGARGASREEGPDGAAEPELRSRESRDWLELASARFREERWAEAARFAERAVGLDSGDSHAWSVLAASRFLEGDRESALEAWNARGEPRLDLVELKGFEQTRQEVVYRYLALPPRSLLTPEVLNRARRRVRELPTVESARVSYEPLPRGRANLIAFVSERKRIERPASLLFRGSVDALARREGRFLLSGPAGGGALLEAGARWWENRPAFWVALSGPGMLSLPGIVTAEGFVEEQSYRAGGEIVREVHRGGRISFGDWLRPSTRAGLGVGFERVSGRGDWLSLRGEIEHRLWEDRVALEAGAAGWLGAGEGDSFAELAAGFRGRSAVDPRWSLRYRLGARLVAERAPLAFWPGAGADGARPFLLRGHALLENGSLTGDAFAPRLLHGSVEAERELWRPGVVELGLASFLDWARTAGNPRVPGKSFASLGAGLRLHAFGRILRLDGATSLERGGFLLSAGWIQDW